MTPETIEFAKEAETGKPITTTIKDIIANRILWEGDSGSGKSHGMVGMIEETDGLAQRIIIDPEGEYFPLKDNFQFLLIGQKTEQVTPNVILNLNDVYVDKLIKKLIEISSDAIIDLSENPGEATHFLNVFQKAIFKYAKLMKRPLLIFVDEGQIFAPEKGQGSEESLTAMKQLAKRGRKRGIGLICGTQAIADFSKDVVRQLRTRFIGNCTYDNDVKAAAHFLGFGKEREPELRDLADETRHYFFVSGKGIMIGGKRPKQVIKIQANENKTKLCDFNFNKNFKLKERDAEVMKDLAANFSEIPQLIDEELSEKETLQKDNFELKKQIQEQKVKLIQLERQQPKVDPKLIEKSYSDGYDKALKHSNLQHHKAIQTLQGYIKGIKIAASNIQRVVKPIEKTSHDFTLILQTEPTLPKIEKPEPPKISFDSDLKHEYPTLVHQTATKFNKIASPPLVITAPGIGEAVTLANSETKVLTAILQCPNQRGTRRRIGLYCGYAIKGGAFHNILGRLRSSGLIQYSGDILIATDEGIAAIPSYEPLPTEAQEIITFWTNKLGQAKGKVLTAIYEAGTISRDDLAEKTGYTESGGAFSNTLGSLRTVGLIDYLPDKQIGISKEIFPEIVT